MASGEMLDRLQANIKIVNQDPSQPLDIRTFEDAELLISQVPKDQRVPIIQAIVGLLPTLQQDPTPVVNLLIRYDTNR